MVAILFSPRSVKSASKPGVAGETDLWIQVLDEGSEFVKPSVTRIVQLTESYPVCRRKLCSL